MNILSWDVGVCNLAFCYLRYEEGKVTILDWGKINLCIPYNKCDEVGCTNQAIYSAAVPAGTAGTSGSSYCCKLHHRKGHRLTDSVRSSKSIDDMRMCLYEWLESRDSTLGYADPDDRRSWLRAQMVLIENQPALKNPGMKSMACAIFDYFLLRCVVRPTPLVGSTANLGQATANLGQATANLGQTRPTIKFVSAMKKTKTVPPQSIMYVDPPDESKLAEWSQLVKYKQTKARGIWLCERILTKLNIDKSNFEAHTKQDDMADAFLQALTALPLQL